MIAWQKRAWSTFKCNLKIYARSKASVFFEKHEMAKQTFFVHKVRLLCLKCFYYLKTKTKKYIPSATI